MADDTEDLVLTISADTRQILNALKRLETQTKGTTDNLAQYFVSASTATDPLAKKLAGVGNAAQQAGRNIETGMGRSQQATLQLTQRLDHLQSAFAGNQSPLQIAVQQAAHFQEILAATGGGTAALGAVGDAFLGLLNPINLVIVGLVAATAYSAKYFESWISGSSKSKEQQKEDAKNVADLAKNWGDALTGLQAYQDAKDKQVTDTKNQSAYQSAVAGKQSDAISALQSANVPLAGALSVAQFHAPIADINSFQQALRALAAAGTDTNKILAASYQVQSSLAQLATDTGSPAIDKLSASFKTLLDSATDATTGLAKLNQQAGGVGLADAFSEMQRAISEIDPSGADQRLQEVKKSATDLEQEFRTGQISISQFINSINGIEAADPDVTPLLEKIKSVAQAAADAAKSIGDLVGGRIETGGGKGARVGSQTMDQAQSEFNARLDMARRFGDLDSTIGVQETVAKPAAKAHLDPFQRGMQQAGDRTAEINAEIAAQSALNPLVNDYGQALATATEKQKLINDAQKAGVEITPEVLKSIDQQADAYGTSVAALARVKAAQDQLKQSVQQTADAAKEFTSTFIDDLIDGKSAAESLGDALKALGKQFENLAMNELFGGGGNPQVGGLFGQLFGGLFGASTKFPAAPSGGIFSGSLADLGFASGTDGAPPGWAWVGEKGPELMKFRGGEKVMPHGMSVSVARGYAGGIGVPVMPSIGSRSSGSSSSTMHVTVQVQGVGDKDLLAKTAQGATLAVHQALKTYDKTIPGKVRRFSSNHRDNG